MNFFKIYLVHPWRASIWVLFLWACQNYEDVFSLQKMRLSFTTFRISEAVTVLASATLAVMILFKAASLIAELWNQANKLSASTASIEACQAFTADSAAEPTAVNHITLRIDSKATDAVRQHLLSEEQIE